MTSILPNKLVKNIVLLSALIAALSYLRSPGEAGAQTIITADSFGFQCSTVSCPSTGTQYTWPDTQAQPGVLRLWDSSTQWDVLNPTGSCSGTTCTSGSYSFTTIDKWLDTIAAQWTAGNQVQVIYTFGWVPYWVAPTSPSTCQQTTSPYPGRGSQCPPLDLTSSGSPTFNAFVTALVAHCSSAGNCVSKYIKYWELWNEPDVSTDVGTWTGTVLQMYQMLAPIPAIINGAISGATMIGPTISDNASTSVTWMNTYLGYEISSGVLSNIYGFHIYLQNKTPETAITASNGGTNNGTLAQIAPNESTTGWTPQPMWLTETSFANATESTPYLCDTSLYSTTDCAGQVARWHLLNDSNGITNVTWYSWLNGIGSDPASCPTCESVYYYMMQLMENGWPTAAGSYTTSGGIETWTVPYEFENGVSGLWVWTPTEAGTSYTVPSGYTSYKDLAGNSGSVTPGNSITIGVEPILLLN
jgi:hypothetical protein